MKTGGGMPAWSQKDEIQKYTAELKKLPKAEMKKSGKW